MSAPGGFPLSVSAQVEHYTSMIGGQSHWNDLRQPDETDFAADVAAETRRLAARDVLGTLKAYAEDLLAVLETEQSPICQGCGGIISQERLKAMLRPLCIECARKADKSSHRLKHRR